MLRNLLVFTPDRVLQSLSITARAIRYRCRHKQHLGYGVHTPYAIKDFLGWTYAHWQRQPKFVMLAGSGTPDPRNYTGEGSMDFVHTKLIDTISDVRRNWILFGDPTMRIRK